MVTINLISAGQKFMVLGLKSCLCGNSCGSHCSCHCLLLLLLHLLQFLNLLLPDWHFLICHVSLGVLGEVVAAHELARADWTLVLLFPSVRAFVSSQFIRASKPPPAVLPSTHIRLLSGVSPHVGFQMGALVIGLPAARVITHEWFWSVLFL